MPALDGPGPGGPPAVVEGSDGYVVSWPAGRPGEFPIGSAFFEALVEEANIGRRAVDVLKVIADALTQLVPST